MKKISRAVTFFMAVMIAVTCMMSEGFAASNKNTVYNGIDYSAVYDKDYYLSHNPDLKAVYGDNPAALLRHFVTSGMSEGRQGNAEFNVAYYSERYSDLQDVYGDNWEAYYRHYMNYGKAEGRVGVSEAFYNGRDYSAVYNKEYYLANNEDLRAVIGNDSEALIQHFVTSGMQEGRVASENFNIDIYMSNYPDLVELYGEDKGFYYLHYIEYGQYEDRVATRALDGSDIGSWEHHGNDTYYIVDGRRVTGYRRIDGRIYYFNDSGILSSMLGIDVSGHHGVINWNQLKEDGIQFAIIRLGYGEDLAEQDDSQAIRNIEECERLGIPYGVYLYSYAMTTADVASEVAHAVRVIGDHNPTLGVFIDMEDADGYKKRHGMPSADTLSNICADFIAQMEQRGYHAGIYASTNWHEDILNSDRLSTVTRWVAQWADTCTYSRDYSIWQFTSTGVVQGIDGRVDLDILINR